MLNEGVLTNDSKILLKSETVRQLRRLAHTTPDELERAVFEALTGGKREEIDWDVEDNRAGYFLWTKTFDSLITELIDDGYILVKEEGEGNVLVAAETDPNLDVSQLVYPSDS
jgi:hypothetical protein